MTGETHDYHPNTITAHEHNQPAFSLTTKLYDKQGFEWLLTVRDGIDVEQARSVWKVAQSITCGLLEHGASPAYYRSQPPGVPTLEELGAPAPQPQPTGNGGDPAEKMCSIHQVMMPRRTKNGHSWYSHQLQDGTWCRGV